jgi:hypothetical protein
MFAEYVSSFESATKVSSGGMRLTLETCGSTTTPDEFRNSLDRVIVDSNLKSAIQSFQECDAFMKSLKHKNRKRTHDQKASETDDSIFWKKFT